MVKIAVIGGTGDVAREIVDTLVATGKHDILLLSRKAMPASDALPKTKWVQADYTNTDELATTLQGVHTVLSFVTVHTDPGNATQKNLIEASIRAGVKRFAPSEWVVSKFEHMPWYAGKGEIRDYLKAINKDKKVLEYTLFQPSLFVDYFTYPYKSARHVSPMQTQIDFENRRAIVPDNYESAQMNLISAQDLANIVAKAIDYEGEWPVVGGIQGSKISIAELIKIGEEVRGGTAFNIEKVKFEDAKAGNLGTTWLPVVTHPSFTPEQAEAMAVMFTAGLTLGISTGAFEVSDEWNKIFPDYEFTQARQFLAEAWKGKP